MAEQTKAQDDIAQAVRYLADKPKTPPEYLTETGKAIMLLANLAAGALIFSEGSAGFFANPRLAVIGVLVVLALYGLALYVMKGGGSQ